MRKFWAIVVVIPFLLGLLGTQAAAGQSGAQPSPQTFLVALQHESVSDAVLAAVHDAGGTVSRRVDRIGLLAVTARDVPRFVKAMLANPEVAAVTPSVPVRLDLPKVEEPSTFDAATFPADPSDPASWTWGVHRVTDGGAAWEIHAGTHDVVVGVIDTGIDPDHPDLAPNFLGGRNYVDHEPTLLDLEGHGTHVAGTIAANGRVKGVAPGVGIRAYRVLDSTGSGAWEDIIQAIVDAADDGVDVINMSLGGFAVNGQWWYTDPDTGERIRLGGDTAFFVALNRAIRYATGKNVTVVVAAGNEALNLAQRSSITRYFNAFLHELGYTMYEVQGATFNVPGTTPGAVTVSAMGGGWGTADRLAFYSNYQLIDVTAPGGDLGPDPSNPPADYLKHLILSTAPTYQPCNLSQLLFGACGYSWKVGTSMAAPHASGVAALIISQQYAETGTKPTPSQVVARLKQSAADLGKKGHDALYGSGLVNAYQALVSAGR